MASTPEFVVVEKVDVFSLKHLTDQIGGFDFCSSGLRILHNRNQRLNSKHGSQKVSVKWILRKFCWSNRPGWVLYLLLAISTRRYALQNVLCTWKFLHPDRLFPKRFDGSCE